ncbi:MAG TPA: pyrroloquinoline quinone biosynthesis protein PqqE [Candidatus Binataceae bacterium]|nr:pyrroloquinoline quinone biosynthesis protein PqqE [Candidatus Binataceae bacterium]
MSEDGSNPAIGNPLWLLAELTYRCPLHCVYCSNPIDYLRYQNELSTEEWLRVLREGRELGFVQLGFSGGEPLVRDDLEVLVREAHGLGYYTNLITSGVGLDERRAAELRASGLDHIQLSLQDSTRELNDFLSHTRTFDLKLKIARLIKQQGYPMVLNVVLHRQNLDHIEEILSMAERLEAEYLELANTQYYGWAFLNREHLLPSAEQLRRAEEATQRFRQRVGNAIKVYFVVSDYYEKRPKPCMNGWGSVFMVITPDGLALPCHEARALPGLVFPRVREQSLRSIWYESPGFQRFRGFDWMGEPCRSCPERFKDFGGCRCQAYLLTANPANTDPVCELSPHHHRVAKAVQRAQRSGKPQPLQFRDDRNSRALSSR